MSGLVMLDTHILLWLILDPLKISDKARDLIKLAEENNQLMISSISLWEISVLQSKRRINIYEPLGDFLRSIVDMNGLSVKDISPEMLVEHSMLFDDFHKDPVDRIIVATTKLFGATLVTRDQKILDWSKFGYIKSLKG